MGRKKKVSWRKVNALCKRICKQVSKDYTIEHVIGISRGGLIPAVICAKILNVREVTTFGLRSYDDDDSYETRTHTPTVYQDVTLCPEFCTPTNTLIVDDISDKGNTFTFIEQHIKARCTDKLNYITTASLYVKPGTQYAPDYYGDIADEKQWIVFPWER